MKSLLVIGLVCATLTWGHAIAGNYTLTVNGKKHELDLGKEVSIGLPDGKSIQVILEKKAIITFEADHFSYDHSSNVTPSRTNLGEGVHQTMMTTPLGSLVLVQEYANLDPSSLIDLMLNELTKEERRYGYRIVTTNSEVKLRNGIILTGKKSIASYRGTETIRHVFCYSIRDAGIMVVTQINKDAPGEDREMIATFWKTLKISLK